MVVFIRGCLPPLSRYHWVNSAQATNHSYADSGVFAIAGSAEPENLHHLIRVIISELRYTAEAPIEAGELQRAKNQLESMLLMNLEMNPVSFEDIARQVLGTGEWKPPAYWVEKISKCCCLNCGREMCLTVRLEHTFIPFLLPCRRSHG